MTVTNQDILKLAPWMAIATKEIGVMEPGDLKYFQATSWPNPPANTDGLQIIRGG